LYDSFHSWN
jgi:hypothetical protein